MNTIIKRERDFFVIFIFLSAFLIRFIYIMQISKYPLTEYFIRSNTFDQYFFDREASFIAKGNWFGGAEVFRTEPFYSYFLATIYNSFSYSYLRVFIIQALLTSLGCIFIYKASSMVFNKITAYMASFIFSCYSMSIYYDVQLLRESLITFLYIGLFYFLIRSYKKKGLFLYAVAGIFLGLSMLTRLNILILPIIIFILLKERPIKYAFKGIACFMIGLMIIVMPVLVRNYIASDYKKICIAGGTGAFWVGNSYNSSGVEFDKTPQYYSLVERSKDNPILIANIFIQEIKKHPIEYLKLYARKTWMFLNGYEIPSNTNYYLYREEFSSILRLPLFNFQFICAFGILGLFLSLKMAERPYLAYFFLFTLSISVMLFHIFSRYRLPVVPFFILFCAYGIYRILEKIKKRDFLAALFFLIFTMVLYKLFMPDLTYAGYQEKNDKIRPMDRTNLALSYIDDYKSSRNIQNLDRALRQCQLALLDEKASYIPYSIKGHIYLLKGKFDTSLLEYKKALIFSNKNPFLYNELAGVYFLMHAYKKAELFVGRALLIQPQNKIFKQNLSVIPSNVM